MGFIKGAEDALKPLFATIALRYAVPGAEETKELLDRNEEVRKLAAKEEAKFLEARKKELGL